MAQRKETIDEAWPGDIVGLPDNGVFKIGDTLTEGECLHFRGLPSFSPEMFKYIENADPMKTKQLEKGIEFDEAVEIVTKTCAYTNHTILAEALEKWPRAYLDTVVPQLMPIIEKLDALARTRTKDESLAIIDKDDRVHMAHMDIHFTHSTNGVAALHTEILKNSELHGFSLPGTTIS